MSDDLSMEYVLFKLFDLAMENAGRLVDIRLEPDWKLFAYASPNKMLFRLESHRTKRMIQAEWTDILVHLPMSVPIMRPTLLEEGPGELKMGERWTWIIYKCPICGSARVLDEYLELMNCKHCLSKKRPDVIHELIP